MLHIRFLFVALFCVVLFLSACDSVDSPLDAGQHAQLERDGTKGFSRTNSGRKDLISSQVKYRDTSLKTAAVTSGSVTLSARASLGKDGVTKLEVTTGNIDDPGYAPGNISQLSVKLLDPNNPKRAVWTKTYRKLNGGGYVVYTYQGLARGMELQVTATVEGIDAAPVTLTLIERVKLQPNLALELAVPGEVGLHVPVPIGGTVRETNGDMGAWADCVLYIENNPVDWVYGIWVDAFSTVTCAFAPTFQSAGTKQVRVAVENVRPFDYDLADNSTTGVIEVKRADHFQYFDAGARADLAPYVTNRLEEWIFRSGDGNYTNSMTFKESRSSQIQESYVMVWTPRKFQYPITSLSVSESTGSTTLYAATFTDFSATYWYGGEWQGDMCAEARSQGASGNIYLYACSSWSQDPNAMYESSSVVVTRWAGAVTYHSERYETYFDGLTGRTSETYYTTNESVQAGTPLPVHGEDLRVRIDLNDGGTMLSFDRTFNLYSAGNGTSKTNWCNEYTDGSTGDYSRTCVTEETSLNRIEGWASGPLE